MEPSEKGTSIQEQPPVILAARAVVHELRNELTMLVALELPGRALYLRRLKEHVEKLEAEINEAANNFEKTVDERFEQLMADPADATSALAEEPPT